MAYKKERHIFLGGNTYKGFYSFFDNILNLEDANRLICIKGGPGTGKSYLMKKVAAHFLNKGYSVEYGHCSSDEKSLDGIVVPDLKIAMLDGTSPHMTDPIYPGAVDEIVNMGVALNSTALSLKKKEIFSVQKEISNNFKRAYKFLAAAKPIHDDWSKLNSMALDYNKIITISESLKEEVFNKQKSGFGEERHVFATAFTPSGLLTFAEDLVNEYKNKFILKGGPGFSKTKILKELGKLAQKKGYFVEYLHDPFIPERLEHILIPEIDTAIVTENEISKCSFKGRTYNLIDFCTTSKLNENKNEIEYNMNIFYELINKALSLITKAHILHDDLEAYYIDSIDTSVLDNIYSETIEKLDKYIN